MILTTIFAAVPGCATSSTYVDTSCLPRPDTTHTLAAVLNIVFAITASVAVLMIVIAGFRYVAAHGDSNAMAQARNTIIYSVVGLLVTMVAFSVVSFVVKGVG